MSLFCALSRIAEHIQQQRHLMNNEEATLQVSIRPFIEALGYNTRNLSEVAPQFTADPRPSGTDRVDYAILRDNYPVILIEAKSVNTSLTENNWKQLHDYFNAEEVRLGILTNGLEYRFYSDLKKRNIMDKQPFLTIDMLNLDERLVAELDSFTKANFDPQRILNGAQKRRIARLLARELEQPSDDFVRFFAKQVHSGRLTEEDAQRYRQLVQEAWRGMVKGIENDSNGKPVDPEPKPPPDGAIPIVGYYEGHRFDAVVMREHIIKGLSIAGHCIRYEGKLMNTTTAAIAAIRSVNPSFEYKRGKPNGFMFWHVADPADGKEHMIRYISGWEQTDEALRERVLSS